MRWVDRRAVIGKIAEIGRTAIFRKKSDGREARIAEDAERGVFVCRWQITEDYFEDYEEIWPEWLYATEEEALQKIRREKEA